MPHAVIVSAVRTPIGRAYKGSLATSRPDELLAAVLRGSAERADIDTSEIVDVSIGCAFPHRELMPLNVTRGATLLAGYPDTVPSTVVNRFCSSSLQAIRMAQHAIEAGDGDLFVAAGVEGVSRCPAPANDVEGGHPGLMGPEAPYELYLSMGETAERVADKYGVTREDMDRFAQQSQVRAVAAQQSGFFDTEILPWTTPEGTVVTKDDGPRADSTYERLASLAPAFREDGRVTAGNSCPLNDGAAAVVLMSDERAQAEGRQPLARILSSAVSGLDPQYMGVGPIEAVSKALDKAGLGVSDVGVLELNEAFAAQVLAVCRELGFDTSTDVVNPHGGGIALGHPFGMTGARIMTTLLNDLRTLDRSIGVETMCVGGGMGMAMVVERLS